MPRNTRVDGEKPSHTECKQIKSIQRFLSFSLIQNPFHSHSPYPRKENGRSDHTRVAFPIHTINHRRMVTRGPFLLSLLVYLVLRVRLALAFRGCGVSVGQIQAGGGIGHVGAGSREGGRKNKRRSRRRINSRVAGAPHWRSSEPSSQLLTPSQRRRGSIQPESSPHWKYPSAQSRAEIGT